MSQFAATIHQGQHAPLQHEHPPLQAPHLDLPLGKEQEPAPTQGCRKAQQPTPKSCKVWFSSGYIRVENALHRTMLQARLHCFLQNTTARFQPALISQCGKGLETHKSLVKYPFECSGPFSSGEGLHA